MYYVKGIKNIYNNTSLTYTFYMPFYVLTSTDNDITGELGYDRLNGTRKIGPSYAKSVIYI